MSSTILVCTDGSDAAIAAIRTGVRQLALADRLVLATVLEPLDPTLVTGVSGFGAGSMSPEEYEQIDRGRRRAADEMLADTIERAGLHEVETVLLDGPAGPSICDAAADLGAHVIVMGSRGRGGLRRAVLGSVSDHVVRNAPCSVLVTSTHAEHDG